MLLKSETRKLQDEVIEATGLPKYVYIAGINLSGLWSKKPLKAKLYPDLNSWYSCEKGWGYNDVGAEKLGLHKRGGLTTFASVSKQEVQIWLDGATTVLSHLRDWSSI